MASPFTMSCCILDTMLVPNFHNLFKTFGQWWDKGSGARLKARRGCVGLKVFYGAVKYGKDRESQDRVVSYKTGGRWEDGQSGDPQLFQACCEQQSIEVWDLWLHSKQGTKARAMIRARPDIRLFEHLQGRLRDGDMIEVIGPPGTPHASICHEAVVSLKSEFPRPYRLDASKRRDLSDVWQGCARLANIPPCSHFDEFVRAAKDRGCIFIIERLDVLCASFLSGSHADEHAREIIRWLNDLNEQPLSLVVCGNLQVKALVRLINPAIESSPHSLKLVDFPTNVRWCAYEWEMWCEQRLRGNGLGAADREKLQSGAARNPGALDTGLAWKGQVEEKLNAIKMYHRDVASQIHGLIPRTSWTLFFRAVLDKDQTSPAFEMLKDGGVVESTLDEAWKPRWTELRNTSK
jgi:hypothetical protein